MKPLPEELKSSAWIYGVTAFTTVRTRWGIPLHLELHLTRLAATCAWLDLPQPTSKLPLLDPLPWGLLRLTVTPEGVFWSHQALNPKPRPLQGVRIRMTDVHVHEQLAMHKTGNYLPYLLAGREAVRAEAFEGWMLGHAGNLVDGSRTSPLLELGGQLIVPVGGLPSVTRAVFITGRSFDKRQVPVQQLSQLTRAWVCGSGIGIVPVREIIGGSWRTALSPCWPDVTDPALMWPE